MARFGQKFVGEVANPRSILHWHRQRKLTSLSEVSLLLFTLSSPPFSFPLSPSSPIFSLPLPLSFPSFLISPTHPSERKNSPEPGGLAALAPADAGGEGLSMPALVEQQLQSQKLCLLSERNLTEALTQFVEKEETEAIAE